MKKAWLTTLILILCMFTSACFAAPEQSLSQINARRAEAKKRTVRLKLLEKIETNKLYSNQQRLERTEQNLSDVQERYTNATKKVVSLENELDDVLRGYKDLKEATNKRIVQIYKIQRKNYVEFLLNAKDINHFLDRLYYENIAMRNDKKNIKLTQQKARNILELKLRIEEQKRSLKDSEGVMKREQKNIQVAIGENEKLIEKLQTDIVTWERSERELARQSNELAALINKSTGGGTSSVPLVTGGFVRPVYGGITSYYGTRIHPIFKRPIFHSGIDIGAPMGTGVRASNSGRVIFAGWYGGYGKAIIVDHGVVNGRATTTLYAHLSVIGVSQGESVSKSQIIGKVGSTGYSTGPHLHFEVRVNGSTVNPLGYVPG